MRSRFVFGLIGILISAAITLTIALWPAIWHAQEQLLGPKQQVLTAASFSKLPGTTLKALSKGTMLISAPAPRWYGAYLADPRLCNYRFSFDVRTLDSNRGNQFGFGVGPGVIVNAEGTPSGNMVQYDHAFGLRYPLLPYDRLDGPSDYLDPTATDLNGAPVVPNDNEHHWTLSVQSTVVQVSMDGRSLRPLQTGPYCQGGVYLRVWDGTAIFSRMVITKV